MRIERRSFLKAMTGALAWGLLSAPRAFVASYLYYPNHSLFEKLRKTFNSAIKKPRPLAIFQPEKSADFKDIVNNDEFKNSALFIRGGGHSYAGFSSGKGLVLDSRKLKGIFVAPDKSSVTLESGVTLYEALIELKKHGLTFPAGEYPTVGIGGYFLGGGHSRRSRLLGIGADVVLSMKVTLADGKRVTVSPTQYEDLYWALLGGGGGNFGFVESFRIKAIPSFNDYFFKFTFSGREAKEAFSYWQDRILKDPDHMSVNLTLYVHDGGVYRCLVSGLIMGQKDLEQGRKELKESHWNDFYNLDVKKFEDQIQSSNRINSRYKSSMAFKGSSHYADRLLGSSEIDLFFDSIKENTQGSFIYLGLYPLGGKVKTPPFKNSYPHRDAHYILDMFSEFRGEESTELFRDNFNSLHRDLDPLFSGRSYVNYPDLDFRDDWPQRYFGLSLERLLTVKKKYDPHHRFNFGQHSLSSLLLNR